MLKQHIPNFTSYRNSGNIHLAVIAAVSMCVLSMTGCMQYTWQDTLHRNSQVLNAARITDTIRVHTDSRWIVPSRSQVCLAQDETVPTNWSIAARAGLEHHFRASMRPGPHCTYQITVRWPIADKPTGAHREKTLAGNLLGLQPWPSLPAAQRVLVTVSDRQSESVATITLTVAPRWLDQPWHVHAHIEKAFAKLGASLIGS